MGTELFNKMKENIKSIIKTMDAVYTEILNKSPYKKQLLSDLRKGYVKVKGLYLPYKAISHRVLFEEYPSVHSQGFISFYKNLFSEIDSYFTEFALRTLIEIGIEITNIIFSKDIKEKEKKRFILNILLTDFGILASRDTRFLTDLERLLTEEGDLLEKGEKINFIGMIKSIKERDLKTHDKSLEIAMKNNSDTQFILFKKTKTPDFIDRNKINILHSWFSHLIHGDIFLVDSIFKEYKNPYQHKLRIHYLLLYVGCNFLYCLQESTDVDSLKNSINQIIKDFKSIEPNIKTFWNKFIRLKYQKNIFI